MLRDALDELPRLLARIGKHYSIQASQALLRVAGDLDVGGTVDTADAQEYRLDFLVAGLLDRIDDFHDVVQTDTASRPAAGFVTGMPMLTGEEFFEHTFVTKKSKSLLVYKEQKRKKRMMLLSLLLKNWPNPKRQSRQKTKS